MDSNTKRLIHEALDAHDTALLAMQATRNALREARDAHTDMALKIEAMRATTDVALDNVMHANRELLDALHADDEK